MQLVISIMLKLLILIILCAYLLTLIDCNGNFFLQHLLRGIKFIHLCIVQYDVYFRKDCRLSILISGQTGSPPQKIQRWKTFLSRFLNAKFSWAQNS